MIEAFGFATGGTKAMRKNVPPSQQLAPDSGDTGPTTQSAEQEEKTRRYGALAQRNRRHLRSASRRRTCELFPRRSGQDREPCPLVRSARPQVRASPAVPEGSGDSRLVIRPRARLMRPVQRNRRSRTLWRDRRPSFPWVLDSASPAVKSSQWRLALTAVGNKGAGTKRR